MYRQTTRSSGNRGNTTMAFDGQVSELPIADRARIAREVNPQAPGLIGLMAVDKYGKFVSHPSPPLKKRGKKDSGPDF